MIPDTLSRVLKEVHLSGGMFVQARFSVPFAVTATDAPTMLNMFAPGADHILPFHLVTAGKLSVAVAGCDNEQLTEGDIIVLPHGAQHTLQDQPREESVHAADLQISGSPPSLVHGGGGDEARVLCGFFHCRGRLYNPLLDALPERIVIRHDPDRSPWLTATLQRTFHETVSARPGSAALVERMTELLFLEVVQRYLADQQPSGWLRGLSDEVVGTALSEIHERPAHDWTVEELARRASVSRSVFAERFSELVGMSPIRYLASWRMELAAQRLLRSSDGIAQIAADVGYESEASFNRAFKKHVGDPPAAWRRNHTASAS